MGVQKAILPPNTHPGSQSPLEALIGAPPLCGPVVEVLQSPVSPRASTCFFSPRALPVNKLHQSCYGI